MTHEQKPLPEPASSWEGGPAGIWLRFQRFFWDITGVAVLAFAVMTLLALWGVTEGALLTPWAEALFRWLGRGSYLVVLIVIGVGLLMLGKRAGGVEDVPWGRVLALEAAAFALIALLAVFGGVSIERAEAGLDGGLVGWGLAELLGLLLGAFLRFVVLLILFAVSLLAGIGRLGAVLRWIVGRVEGQPAGLPQPACVPRPGAVALLGLDGRCLVHRSRVRLSFFLFLSG